MNKIKEIRINMGLTIRDLSKKSNVATGYISKLENDNADITNPTKDVMEKISSALNKTVPEVFFNVQALKNTKDNNLQRGGI